MSTRVPFIQRVTPLHTPAILQGNPNPRRLWACSGQGTQQKGMGQALYNQSEVFRNTIHQANDAFRSDLAAMGQKDTTLMNVMFEGDGLDRTPRTQAALLAGSVAMQRMLHAEGIQMQPQDLVAGHSVGEWSAYVIGGGLSLEEGIRAVHWRGHLMEEAFPLVQGALHMIAVLDDAAVEKLPTIRGICEAVTQETGNFVSPANINSPDQITISGNGEGLAEVKRRLKDQVGRTVDVKVVAPFHSKLMESAANRLGEKLDELGIRVNPTRFGLIANLTGALISTDESPIGSLISQISNSVLWAQSMAEAKRLGVVEVVSLAIGTDFFVKFTSKNFLGNDDPQVFDPNVAMQLNALRAATGTIRTRAFTPTQQQSVTRLLRYSYDVAAIAKQIRKLLSSSTEQDLAIALTVFDNDFNRSREIALREFQRLAPQHPKVIELMAAKNLTWPEPEVRDLPRTALPDEVKSKLIQVSLPAVAEKDLAPVNEDDFFYYFESRWNGDEAVLAKLILNLDLFLTFNPLKLKLQGVDEWNKLTVYLDKKIKFPHPGAVSKADLPAADLVAENLATNNLGEGETK